MTSGKVPEIQVRNLELFYGDNKALKNINLDIESKKVTALIGPSGCGKSTAAKMVMGLIPVDGGSIYYEDIYLVDTEQHRKIKNKEMKF